MSGLNRVAVLKTLPIAERIAEPDRIEPSHLRDRLQSASGHPRVINDLLRFHLRQQLQKLFDHHLGIAQPEFRYRNIPRWVVFVALRPDAVCVLENTEHGHAELINSVGISSRPQYHSLAGPEISTIGFALVSMLSYGMAKLDRRLIGCVILGWLAVGCAVSTPAQTPDTAASDTRVDLGPRFEQWGLATRSQGSRGTCSVFTVTRAIEYALSSKSKRTSRLSVEFLNWASNRTIGERRDGGFFSDLWKGFERYGICDEEELPYAEEFDRWLRPSDAALAQARQLCESGLKLHWIKPWDPNCGLTGDQFAAVKQTLRQGWPVCGGFLWPKQPEWADGVLQMASRENVRDGHSVLLVGFRDDSAQPGGGVFLVQNTSNGPRLAKMSYEYVRAYMNDAAWIGYDEEASSR